MSTWLLKGITSAWLFFPPPYSSSMFVKKANIGLELCNFPPAAHHYVITVVYRDRGWAQVLQRGHLTAPTPSFLFPASSASEPPLMCARLGQAPLGFRKQLLRAGFVGECKHTARLLWALLGNCYRKTWLFESRVCGYRMLVNKRMLPPSDLFQFCQLTRCKKLYLDSR